MSHGIMEIDSGYVWGDTWHGLPQYIVLDRPVKEEEAIKVLNFSCNKQQLYRKQRDGEFVPAEAWEIVRTNEDIPLVPHVGKQFNEGNNLNILTDHILPAMKEFPSLKIESVGTLWSGATVFVNLKVSDYYIKGDQSNIMNRLMWYNPMGKGGYKTCAHSIRVVCNNTLRAAHGEGKDNGSMVVIRHCQNAKERIGRAMDDIARNFMELETQQQLLERLTKHPMNSVRIKKFLDEFIPMPANLEDRAVTMRNNSRDEVMTQFNTDQALDVKIKASGYALLQAVTYVLDHGKATKCNDKASIVWDAMVGYRANSKDKALDILSKQMVV